MKQYGFPKAYKLCSKKEFETVLSKGRTQVVFPFKFIWTSGSATDCPIKIGISIPKRFHKKAVTRNNIRRHIREALRTECSDFFVSLQNEKRTVYCLIVYSDTTIIPSPEIVKKIRSGIKKIVENHEYH
ncbi:MAG: ribonuclease P protein component [Bacteroidales bacterium]|jgi:ribonuclease P protein component|nr:ribonuclease P protein component [Bacteroidales bacterium]